MRQTLDLMLLGFTHRRGVGHDTEYPSAFFTSRICYMA